MNNGIYLKSNCDDFVADICDVIRLYYPVKKIVLTKEICGSICINVSVSIKGTDLDISSGIFIDNILKTDFFSYSDLNGVTKSEALLWKKLIKRSIKKNVYELLKKHSGIAQPWGALTGIRPAKFIRDLQHERKDSEQYITEIIDVSREKYNLATAINRAQEPYLNNRNYRALDVYIGIPFCKTRCSYCSFVSREYEKNVALKDSFLEALKKEMAALQDVVNSYEVNCVYIGGGTPTALNDFDFSNLLDLVDCYFPVRHEYTVEAGRPDTINETKLDMIREHRADRICINPQTTSAETLTRIGRLYPSELYFQVFELARNKGFDCINSDIIFGLPGESKKIMLKSLQDVIGLLPENITIHTLAMKNSSYLIESEGVAYCNDDVVSAVSEASAILASKQYIPYYLYRQKYMSGNLENTGYAKEGHICEYNIDNMEETTSVIAFGPGGISKRVYSDVNRIERACNVKDVKNYCDRIDVMVKRKQALFSFDTE